MHLWEFPFDGSEGRQLTQGPGSNFSPKYSPDGATLAFVSTREGGEARIYLLERAGGDARCLGQAPSGIVDIAWSPDGAFLLATASLTVDPDLRGERGSAPKAESLAEVAWKLPYKTDGVGYMLGREIHLFKIDARTGKSRQLTDGPFDVFGFDVSPDLKRVVYTRSSSGRFAHRSELWTFDLEGGSHKRAACELATVLQPVWSPGGQLVVFAGAELEGDAQSRFWLLDAATSDVSPLGAGDVEPASGQRYYWKADGSAVVFVRARRGRHHPALLSVPSGELAEMPGPERQLSAFDGTESCMAYSVDHPALPSELWVRWFDGPSERKLSSFNAWWNERTEIQAEIRSFQVPDGSGGLERIEGWLIMAKGRRGPGPLLDDPHGGPATYALMDYDTNVYWQALCSQGWAVLALNPVGSASYGPQFCARLRARWGELDLPQHEAAIRALRSEGICDARIAIGEPLRDRGRGLSRWAAFHGQGARLRPRARAGALTSDPHLQGDYAHALHAG